MSNVQQFWSRSRVFRVILVITSIYVVFRLAVHGAYLAMMLFPSLGIMGGAPGWTGADGAMVPVDLQVYLDAAQRFLERQDLYLQGPITRLEDLYQYTPAFALAMMPFLWMSLPAVSVIHTILHIASYAGLYAVWRRIFEELGLRQASEVLALALPVWLLFSAFWSDLGYLNIYIVMALLSSLLIKAVLDEQLIWSVLWTSLILQAKPQWAFAAAIPLLLGNYRFFLKLVAWSVLAYAGVAGLAMVAGGPGYVGQQYCDYLEFLRQLPGQFPWRGPEAAYLGYNHSIKQIVIYFLGESPKAFRLATLVKLILLAPLGVVVGRYLWGSVHAVKLERLVLGLELGFALYLGAFIWLDMVWELSLGIAIFSYLLATVKQWSVKGLIWIVFLPYALIDLWQLVSLAVFGIDVVEPGPYVMTDPSIYVPLTMMVLLTFYALLIKRLWQAAPALSPAGVKARV